MRAQHNHYPDDVFRVVVLIAEGLPFRRGGTATTTPLEGSPPAAPASRRGWLDRLDRWFWQRRQRDLESFLGRSKDVYELEARIRDIERGFPTRYY